MSESVEVVDFIGRHRNLPKGETAATMTVRFALTSPATSLSDGNSKILSEPNLDPAVLDLWQQCMLKMAALITNITSRSVRIQGDEEVSQDGTEIICTTCYVFDDDPIAED